ncbi:MAG: hypothetical protein NUV90_02815 [Candidatus Parcubacteria bacterium]|nr:hypothetical protein [Candidatus Parcubacteria bacterium]
MPRRKLDQKVRDFLKMYDNPPKGGHLRTIDLRDRLTVKQTTVAVAEIIKKEVRKWSKENPRPKKFGVSMLPVCPRMFSSAANARALNHLVKNEGMKLCYSHDTYGNGIGIKF